MFDESIDYCANNIAGNYYNSIVHTVEPSNIFIIDNYICEFLSGTITSLVIEVKVNCCETPVLSRVLNINDTDVINGFVKLDKDVFFNRASSTSLETGIYEITLKATPSTGTLNDIVNCVFVPNDLICDVAQAIIKSNINKTEESNRADLMYNALLELSKTGCSKSKDMCIIYGLLLKELDIQNGNSDTPCTNC